MQMSRRGIHDMHWFSPIFVLIFWKNEGTVGQLHTPKSLDMHIDWFYSLQLYHWSTDSVINFIASLPRHPSWISGCPEEGSGEREEVRGGTFANISSSLFACIHCIYMRHQQRYYYYYYLFIYYAKAAKSTRTKRHTYNTLKKKAIHRNKTIKSVKHHWV